MSHEQNLLEKSGINARNKNHKVLTTKTPKLQYSLFYLLKFSTYLSSIAQFVFFTDPDTFCKDRKQKKTFCNPNFRHIVISVCAAKNI